MSLFAELKRRNVFRVGIAYLVSAWLLLQLTEVLVELLGLPDTAGKFVVLLLVIGFIPALIFAWAFELTPEGLKREAHVDRTQSITRQTGRKLDYAIIAMLALAVAYLLADKFREIPEAATPIESAATETAAPASDVAVEINTKSIAVLPFTNMSGDAENEFFSDGISEEILNALARVKELKVAGRTSSFAFKGRNEDLRAIGETLGVNHILEGSVRKAGNTVRVTAQLIQVSDGFHLWSDTYDRELTDIFAIQDEIAGAILTAMKAELIGEEQVASTRTDTAAYEKYLLAKQRIYSRTVPAMQDAMRLLDEAIELDPDFAPAWAQRGIVTMLLAETEYGSIPYARAQAEARRHLSRALELDENLPEALAGMGLWLDNQPGNADAEQGIAYLEQALALNPNLINASNWLQSAYSNQNREAESLAILKGMLERDPLYPPVVNNLVYAYLRTNQAQKAAAVLDRARPYYSGLYNLASVEALFLNNTGRQGEALEYARHGYVSSPTNQNSATMNAVVLLELGEIEAILDIENAEPWIRIFALQLLNRPEESTMLARAHSQVKPQDYISLLADLGKAQQLIEYVELGWADLRVMHEDIGRDPGWGAWLTQDVAWAYQALDQQEAFTEAMAIAREENEAQREAGFDNREFSLALAEYWVLAADHEQAIDHVERSVDMGLTMAPIVRFFPTLQPLAGEPRFEAAQSRAREQLARQREIAGLPPLEAEQSL